MTLHWINYGRSVLGFGLGPFTNHAERAVAPPLYRIDPTWTGKHRVSNAHRSAVRRTVKVCKLWAEDDLAKLQCR
jgi:hypothetical protein